LFRIGKISWAGAALAALTLAGCAAQQGGAFGAPPAPAPAGANASVSVAPRPIQPGAPTGTFVGAKVLQLRGDLETMQRGLAAHSRRLRETQASTQQVAERYHGLVAAINARLQVGTTKGNPILTGQLSEAQGQLTRIDGDLARLSELSSLVSTDSALAGYLLEAVRAAYDLSGAVDEDHRQLAILEDEVARTVVLIDRLLSEINTDVTRQTAYLSRERRNITTLALAVKNGESYGDNLAVYADRGPAPALTPLGQNGARASRPLVVIRFDRANVEYQQSLYRAVAAALDRRPSARFEVEAVAPGGSPSAVSARRHAERVVRTLVEMGVPRDRIVVSERTASDARTDETRIYVR